MGATAICIRKFKKYLLLNYYSHYYFDAAENNVPYNFGLVLPDFVRNFSYGQRMKWAQQKFEDSRLQDLHNGVSQHFKTDKFFHGCDFFKVACKEVEHILELPMKTHGLPRVFFAAHLLVEMVLDRVLMQEDNLQGIEKFYAEIANMDYALVATYFEKTGLKDFENIRYRIERFYSIKYLIAYLQDERLGFSLSKIYEYSKASEMWTEKQIFAIAECANDMEQTIKKYLPTLKAAIQNEQK